MYNIICVKWGTLYSSEYVNNLYSMVKRNTTLPFKFYCMTDNTSGIINDVICLPIINDGLEGWWHKITFFKSPFYNLSGPTLTLDLDMVIIDNIDCFLTYDGDFCIEQDYYPQNGFNSSIMKFMLNKNSDIHDDFLILDQKSNDFKKINNTRAKYWGDQAWITEKRPNATLWPSDWVQSYKLECINNNNLTIPNNCKIILFHGYPNPHEVLHHVGNYWC